MRSLDYAKYAQLYKNSGIWKGNQILSKEWIQKTFAHQIKIPERENEFYSYLFWNKSVEYKESIMKPTIALEMEAMNLSSLKIFRSSLLLLLKLITNLTTSTSRKNCKRFYFTCDIEIKMSFFRISF